MGFPYLPLMSVSSAVVWTWLREAGDADGSGAVWFSLGLPLQSEGVTAMAVASKSI